MRPDMALEGHIDSIQQGSGSRFSAFPSENATGNFVKIVQRVPVKIVIDKGLDRTNRCRWGCRLNRRSPWNDGQQPRKLEARQ